LGLKPSCEPELLRYELNECQFGYRDSIFKQVPGLIIWNVGFDLHPGDKAQIEKDSMQYIAHRKIKHPPLGTLPSAGSVFKNPTVEEKVLKLFEEEREVKSRNSKVPAGWLIECCDLKGKKIGGAMVSEQQSNFIVNTGRASAKDILMLISIIKQKVRNSFGVQLQEEIHIVY
jgi:UDP-N-acetylmuramate dehydrogenase